MDFKLAESNQPTFNGVNYLVITQLGNYYSFSFIYWDGREWNPKKGKVVAFTESHPKNIIKNLEKQAR